MTRINPNWGRRLWHVTPKDNLSSILGLGLLPQIGPRSAALGELVPAVFCFDSPEDLSDALLNWLPDQFDDDQELSLLEIQTPLSITPVEGAGFEILVLETIPASRICLLARSIEAIHIANIVPYPSASEAVARAHGWRGEEGNVIWNGDVWSTLKEAVSWSGEPGYQHLSQSAVYSSWSACCAGESLLENSEEPAP
jgi:hypothetical protein